MSLQLLVDAEEFWRVLRADLRQARERVWVQTLSLEGDTAGEPLARELIASPATDRRLLVDAFCCHIISDRFIHSPRTRLRPELRAKVRATERMMRDLRTAGIRVGVTNPAGFLWHRLPARDHRKFVLIGDHIAYIGGINFSEHNFAWHDLMIRIEQRDVAAFLRADFEATWQNAPVNAVGRFSGLELHSLSGHGNEAMTERTLEIIRGARRSILAITPYLTFPFTDAMAEARRRGARVTVLSPAINNRASLRRYVHRLARQHGFELRHYPGRMSHLKAMLIDDQIVICGSTNFDWPTYHVLAETIAIIDDPDFVGEFKRRVVEPDMAASVPAVLDGNGFRGRYAELQHRVWAWGARTICYARPGKRVRHLIPEFD
ncbi:MAG TPA: phosphatidylserine/phosphatidylglycerophosphate/cardiolipin synthase family protein [Longimicrobiales bacterium]